MVVVVVVVVVGAFSEALSEASIEALRVPSPGPTASSRSREHAQQG